MTETNFIQVKAFLKAALTELKKGEHDQLSSGLSKPSDRSGYDYHYIITIEEAIKELVSNVESIRLSWGLSE
jgi:hypothetical protein